jgi:hypothetical protein
VNRIDTDDFGCGLLLLVPDGTQGIGRHIGWRGVIESLIATGQKLIRDVVPGACPLRQGCTAEKFGVIGVGEDNENILRRGPGFRFHMSDFGQE